MGILITGGAGFIGSNVAEHLVRDSKDITILDSLHTGSLDNIRGIKNKVKILTDDVMNLNKIGIKGAEKIFHFGIPSSSPMYKENPLLVGDAINGFIGVLEYARRNDSRVVFASSSSLYSGLAPPHREDMELEVSDYYTEARLAMERLAKLYNVLYGTESVALRFFSVYGRHERAKGRFANIVSQFLWCMQEGKRPVIYGDGKQSRDYIYVKDVVRAVTLSMDSGVKCDVFNVGTGKSTGMNDVVGLLNKILGTRIKPEHVENPIKNYVFHTMADCRKAEERLKFKARYGLEEGIRDLLASGPE